MTQLLFLIPLLPLAAALVMVLADKRLPRRAVALIGAGSVGLAAILALAVSVGFMIDPPSTGAYTQTLWNWWQVDGSAPDISLYLDAVSMVWMLIICLVGFLILLYSVEYMREDPGYKRFFGYMDLFVGAMLILVLADNMVFLYLGWEGVGLCSYLLIGFWYRNPENGRAARKAFIVTRVGDTAMAVGLFLLFHQLGTLQIDKLMVRAQEAWPAGSVYPTAAALMLLIGALGKSAQLPLQVWLPDAMAGPTPVSALIHAATMVTAGVYLIVRTHLIFTLAPAVLLLTAVIGAVTLLVAGCSALTQVDIKRVLAYSTISQIGYMFLAMGVGAWTAAVFHFMTHAFFKALLFLGAGAVINAMNDEHNMLKMGGLRKQMPVTFWTFLIGAGALAAVPLITAGFYSKDLIIWKAFATHNGGFWLWLAALTGAWLTSLYTFRMVILTFFGEPRTDLGRRIEKRPGRLIRIPLVVLAVFSLIAGVVELPPMLGGFSPLGDLLHRVLPTTPMKPAGEGWEILFSLISAAASLGGIFVIVLLIRGLPRLLRQLVQSPVGDRVYQFWYAGWGFDRTYQLLFVRPYGYLARINKNDTVDYVYRGIARVNTWLYGRLSVAQSGLLRQYAMGIAAGAALIIGMAVFL